MKLEIEEIAAQQSFVFVWCGSHEGLGEGRKVYCCVADDRLDIISP